MTVIQKRNVDFGKHAADYARHRAGFPSSFFERLDALALFRPGMDLLDLGTGTGTLARGLAKRGCRVTGLDPSEALIRQARRLDREERVSIEYRVSRAEESGFASAGFDCVTAGQCWHWFEHDRVVSEVARLLKPKGFLVVAYFDWMEKPGGPVALMHRLQKIYNPAWKSEWPLGFYPQGPDDLSFPGFLKVTAFSYEEDISYSHLAWRGRMRAYAGIGGSLPGPVVEAFDAEFAEALAREFPSEPLAVPHRVWAGVWKLV